MIKKLFIGLLFISVAWAESDEDVYDPFADYGEFDVSSDEEADINFFHNGRLFTMGIVLGGQGFTGNMGQLYDVGPAYGCYFSYFFDLRFSLQLSLLFSSNNFKFRAFDQEISGSSFLSRYGLDMKYFINTQNIVRGLARFNPYVTAGFSQTLLSSKVDGNSGVANDSAWGVQVGIGVEFPIRDGKSYIGFQSTYKLVTFKAIEGVEIEVEQGPTGIVPRGDLWNFVGILGINF